MITNHQTCTYRFFEEAGKNYLLSALLMTLVTTFVMLSETCFVPMLNILIGILLNIQFEFMKGHVSKNVRNPKYLYTLILRKNVFKIQFAF